jgi:hypothetical protein
VRLRRRWCTSGGRRGALGVLTSVVNSYGSPLLAVLFLLVAALSAGILYLGVRLRKLLIDSPVTINAVLYANSGYAVIGMGLGGGLLLLLYIIWNVRRLAAETLDSATSAGVS